MLLRSTHCNTWGLLKKKKKKSSFISNPNNLWPQQNNILAGRSQESFHGPRIPFSWSTLSFMTRADFHYYTFILSAQLLFSRLGYCTSNLNRISNHHPCPLSESWTEVVSEKQNPGAKNFWQRQEGIWNSIFNCIFKTPALVVDERGVIIIIYYWVLKLGVLASFPVQ